MAVVAVLVKIIEIWGEHQDNLLFLFSQIDHLVAVCSSTIRFILFLSTYEARAKTIWFYGSALQGHECMGWKTDILSEILLYFWYAQAYPCLLFHVQVGLLSSRLSSFNRSIWVHLGLTFSSFTMSFWSFS